MGGPPGPQLKCNWDHNCRRLAFNRRRLAVTVPRIGGRPLSNKKGGEGSARFGTGLVPAASWPQKLFKYGHSGDPNGCRVPGSRSGHLHMPRTDPHPSPSDHTGDAGGRAYPVGEGSLIAKKAGRLWRQAAASTARVRRVVTYSSRVKLLDDACSSTYAPRIATNPRGGVGGGGQTRRVQWATAGPWSVHRQLQHAPRWGVEPTSGLAEADRSNLDRRWRGRGKGGIPNLESTHRPWDMPLATGTSRYHC